MSRSVAKSSSAFRHTAGVCLWDAVWRKAPLRGSVTLGWVARQY